MFGTKHALKFNHDHKHLLLSLLYACSKIMYCVRSAMALYEKTEIFFPPRFHLIYILQRFPALVGYTDLFLIAFTSENLLGHLESSVILEMENITADYSR